MHFGGKPHTGYRMYNLLCQPKMENPEVSGLFLVRTLWLSHLVTNSVSGKWSTHTVWTAEYIKRSLGNDIKTTNCTGETCTAKAHRWWGITSLSPLSLSVLHPVGTEDHLQPSFHVNVLPPFVISLASPCVYSYLTKECPLRLNPCFPRSTFTHSFVISLASLHLWFCSIPIEWI